MRFRKGKKAFRLNRKNKFASRYLLFLKSMEQKRMTAIKMAQCAAIAIINAKSIQSIKAIPTFENELEKSIAIAQVCIDSAFAIQKVFAK